MNTQPSQIQMHRQHSRQGGFTLIEALVALLVAAIGVLGVVGMQMRTLADSQTGLRRAQAIRLIDDLGERLKAHPNAFMHIEDHYVAGFDDTDPTPDAGCPSGSGCDLASWKQTVRDTLKGSKASTFIAPAEAGLEYPHQLGVMIAWRSNEQEGLTDDDMKFTDATQVLDSTGAPQTGADNDNKCPDDYTCHLQYIAVAGRCTPYFASGSPTYFCAGL